MTIHLSIILSIVHHSLALESISHLLGKLSFPLVEQARQNFLSPSGPPDRADWSGYDAIFEPANIAEPIGIQGTRITNISFRLIRSKSPEWVTDSGRSVHPRSPHSQLQISRKLGSLEQSNCIKTSISTREHQVSFNFLSL
jgi:hypothetical protein